MFSNKDAGAADVTATGTIADADATAGGTATKTTDNTAAHRSATAATEWFAAPTGAMVGVIQPGDEFFINSLGKKARKRTALFL